MNITTSPVPLHLRRRPRSRGARADSSDSEGEDEVKVRALWEVVVGRAPACHALWEVVAELGLADLDLVLAVVDSDQATPPKK